MNSSSFFGINPNSKEMDDLVLTATHIIGGKDLFLQALHGTRNGSRTQMSDSYRCTMALAQAANDLDKPAFAAKIILTFVYSFGVDSLDESEFKDMAAIFADAIVNYTASNPELAAMLDSQFSNSNNGAISTENS